jgi:transcriptional regulator with XRE-family HTH domain
MDQEKALARRIQRARKAAGLSQGELGARLGIEQSTVSLIETGVTEVGAIRLVKISAILGRPVTWFLGLDTGLADDEAELLHLYRQIDDERMRAMVMNTARDAVRLLRGK